MSLWILYKEGECVYREKYVPKAHLKWLNVQRENIAKILLLAWLLEIVKLATIAHFQILRRRKTQENTFALQAAIVQKVVVEWLLVPLVPILLVSVLLLPPTVLHALQDKYVAEVVPNPALLFAMLATIAPWAWRTPPCLSMCVT